MYNYSWIAMFLALTMCSRISPYFHHHAMFDRFYRTSELTTENKYANTNYNTCIPITELPTESSPASTVAPGTHTRSLRGRCMLYIYTSVGTHNSLVNSCTDRPDQ